MAPDARPPGPADAEEMVESGFPGEARLVRHHGRDTSRRDPFTRAGELDPGWTATAPGGPLRPVAGTRKKQRMNKVHRVRYADDLWITGTSEDLLRDQVRPLVAHFLKERGLELSHEKTRITHGEDGFDFLGQNVRRYRNGKVLTKP